MATPNNNSSKAKHVSDNPELAGSPFLPAQDAIAMQPPEPPKPLFVMPYLMMLPNPPSLSSVQHPLPLTTGSQASHHPPQTRPANQNLHQTLPIPSVRHTSISTAPEQRYRSALRSHTSNSRVFDS